MNESIQLVKSFYKAFAKSDRAYVEEHLSDDFQFSAPPDPLLNRQGFFERCWPGAGMDQEFKFKRIIISGDEVVVTYEQSHPDGSWGRNTEIVTVIDNKITRAEVYFGWKIEKSEK